MKKFFISICLFPLWGTGGLFAAVTVTPLSVDYSTKKVTFRVSWTNSSAAPYNNRVWIWIDFCPINGVTPQSFSTATISNPAKTGGNGTITNATARGFFIEYSTTNAGTTVTATLSNAPAGQFNWCVYGSDYPPNATVNAGGGYTLRGTKPFTINDNQTVDATTFGAGTCITSIADLTGRTDGFATPTLTVSTSNPAARCGAGAVPLAATAGGGTTTAMTYTWIVGGGAAQTTTTGSLSLSSVAEGSTTYSVTVTNANGCTSAAKTGTITVHTAVATASISGNSSNTCPASTVSLTASATGATSFTWYRNSTQVQTGTSSAYTVTSSGSYTVQGKNANCTGTTSLSHVVIVNGCGDVPNCTGLKLYQTTSAFDGNGKWDQGNNYCNSKNARLPTVTELECMCANKSSLPGGYTLTAYYWSSEISMWTDGWESLHFGQCAVVPFDRSDAYYRCVL
jgi:hypothetical protein